MSNKARNIELMAFDVDGVLTDGRIYYTEQGEALKTFNTLDGHGLKMLRESGVKLAIITGRQSKMVERRAQELGFDFLYQAVSDKRKALSELMVQSGIGREKMGYMGDDIVDLPVMMAVAFRAAPINAHEDVVSRADWVSKRPAGEGAVRELCDYLLKARGMYTTLLTPYLQTGF